MGLRLVNRRDEDRGREQIVNDNRALVTVDYLTNKLRTGGMIRGSGLPTSRT